MTDLNDPLGLLPLLPRVARARGYRLYAENGKRFVDLWQYGGAAALGHTPPRVLLAFKDTASRGLFCPFPGAYARRFEQALSRLVPGHTSVRWYSSTEEADAALAAAGCGGLSVATLSDPALGELPSGCSVALWRPWIPGTEDPLPPVLAPVVPLPFPARPIAFVLEPSVADRFPVSGIVSPVVLAAAARAVSDLAAELLLGDRRPSPRLEKAIFSDARRSARGPYLRFSESDDTAAYAALFRRMLARGFLIPPDPALPAILCPGLSGGEESALAEALLEN